MESHPNCFSKSAPLRSHSKVGGWSMGRVGRLSIVGSCLMAAAIAISAQAVAARPPETATQTAQALPTPLPPLPTNSSPTAPGEQYLVLINGNSDMLLQQVRQVEPGAFVNFVGGRSLIQAGRFSSYENARIRADELAGFGIGAEVQATDYAGAPIAVTPPPYDLTFSSPPPIATPVSQSIPTSTVAATPASIEFGQAAPFPTGVPSSSSAFPPSVPTSTPPNLIAPPTSNLAPPLTTPTAVNNSLPSGYYVVVPGNLFELESLASQLVSLGVPASLVQARTAPRGPHVAVGPYNDHALAEEWNRFLRNSGVVGSRVHFE